MNIISGDFAYDLCVKRVGDRECYIEYFQSILECVEFISSGSEPCYCTFYCNNNNGRRWNGLPE